MVKWIAILLVTLYSFACFAQDDDGAFDVVVANKLLQDARKNFDKDKNNVVTLEKTVAQLIDNQQAARECIKEIGIKLNEIKNQLKALEGIEKQTKEKEFLNTRKTQLQLRQSQCRLYDIQADETVDKYSDAIQQLVTTTLLKRDAPLWVNIQESPALLPTIDDKFNSQKFIEKSGVTLLNPLHIFVLAMLVIIGMIGGGMVKRGLRKTLSEEPSEVLSHQMIHAFCSVISTYSIWFLPIALVTVFLYGLDLLNETTSYLFHLGFALTTYFVLIMAIRFLVSPPEIRYSLNRLPENISTDLANHFARLGKLGVIVYLTYIFLHDQEFPEQFIYFLESIFIIVVSFNLVATIWVVNKMPQMLYKYRSLRLIVSFMLFLTMVCIVAAEVLGYHNLSLHVMQGILWSILLFLVTWFVSKIVRATIDSFSNEQHLWQHRLHYYLGLKKNEQLSELIWVRLVCFFLIWGTFAAMLLQIWGLSETDVRLLIDAYYSGFSIGGFTIQPARIVSALLVFTGLILLTRVVRGYFLRHTRIIKDTSARFALSTILGYIGVVTSVVVSLLVAGVDFTGIAIIAGALSVGVGFGLQNIVNNFLSGLILLVERPIKLGDRILVGDTDGYVKKISIRSTRIRTQARTDVIVPNSELIASQVTNLMFRDKYFRVTIPVSVAYGSDTELVKKALLEVADKSEYVLKIEGQKPKVMFKAFGDSALQFELWCVIANADDINDAPSELHFLIDKKFREYGITIPFPQQDLYVKQLPDPL